MNFLRIAYIGYDWLTTGLVKVLIIIAVLQLVKKIPDVINSIFGTNIKDAGGLKGRLSSMVGGGLALKALSTLGKLGKLTVAAPFAAGAIAGGVAYHKKTGKWLKDNPIFQQAKGIGYGVRGAVKSGSWMTGYQEYEKGSEPPQHSRSELMEYRKNVMSKMAAAGAGNRDGSWDNIKRDEHGNIVRRTDSETGLEVADYKKRDEILTEIENGKTAAKQLFGNSKLGLELSDQLDATAAAKIKYNDLLSVQNAGEKVAGYASDISKMVSSNQSIYSQDTITKAGAIAAKLSGGDRLVTSEDAEFLKRYMDEETAKQFETAVKRYDDALQTTLSAHTEYTAKDLYGAGSVSGLVNAAKDEVDAAVAAEQTISDKMSDIDKVAYQTYSNILDKQTGSLVITNKFNASAPEDLVSDSTGNQVQGWANVAGWNVGAGSELNNSSGSTTSGQTRQHSSQTEPGLFESSGANAPKRHSSSGARHFWEANTGKYGKAEDREKRMKCTRSNSNYSTC